TLETKFTLVHGDPIWSLQFSTDGRELFTRSGNDIRVWRLDSGAETRRFPHEATVQAFALSPDGATLASSSEGSTQLWDAKAASAKHQLPFGGPGRAISYGRDSSFVATVSGSGVRLWNARNAELLAVLQHDDQVQGVVVNPRDGGLLTLAGAQA